MVGNSEAIFVLSASARKIDKDEHTTYRADSYSNLDNHGSMGGGHSRVIAAAEIAQYIPDVKIITTSYDYEDEPTLAKTYARDLEGLGVPKERIELEERSTNTLTELLEMVKKARERGWKKVAILTGEIHLARVQAMWNHLEELAKRLHATDERFFASWDHFKKGADLDIHLLSAEKVLPLRDSRYNKIIEAMRNSDSYRRTAEAEEKGVKQIEDGTYGK